MLRSCISEWCSQSSNRNRLRSSRWITKMSTTRHVIWDRKHVWSKTRHWVYISLWIPIHSTPWMHLENTQNIRTQMILKRDNNGCRRYLTCCGCIIGEGCCGCGRAPPLLPPPGRCCCCCCWPCCIIGMKKFGIGAPPGLMPGTSCCWYPYPGCSTSQWSYKIGFTCFFLKNFGLYLRRNHSRRTLAIEELLTHWWTTWWIHWHPWANRRYWPHLWKLSLKCKKVKIEYTMRIGYRQLLFKVIT